MRLRCLTASIALAIAAAASTVVVVPAAAVTEVTCGAVLTTNSYLTRDLVCTGAGLTLDGDLSLDLRGYKLAGTAQRTAITVTTGHDVQVKNGRIDRWAYGLRVGGEFGPEVLGTISVSNVTFADNIYGIDGQGSQDNIEALVVAGSRFVRNRDGFHGDFSAPLRVSTSTFADNETAVYVDTGSTVSVTDSRLTGNGTGIRCFATVCRALRATFTDNTYGATSGDYGNVSLTDSVVTGNEIGYTAGYGELDSNTFTNNNTGVAVIESGSVKATSNLFTGNGVGVTTVVLEGYTPRVELTDNTFLRNVDGINVTLNPDDSDSQALIRGNIAVGNKRYGIYSPGATDLGVNKATKNGAACVGVQCQEDIGWPPCGTVAAIPRQRDLQPTPTRVSSTTTEDAPASTAGAVPPSCVPDRPGIAWRPHPRTGRVVR